MFTILSRIRLVCCCLLLMLGMGLISKLRDGWSRQLCASLLAKVLRCRLVFGVIRSPALAIKIQTSRLQTSPQIILDNEQLEPYGALEISMKKQPMAHDHLRWVPWIRIPWGMLPSISLAGEINATNRMGSKGQLAETFAELQKVLSWKCVVQSCFLTNCTSSCLWDMGILQIFLDLPK